MWRKILNLFRSKQLEREIREELEFHRSQTAGAFGNITLLQDQTRDAATLVWLETLLQDVTYGLRQLRRTPVLLTVAALSLALGIGANTAVFTLINAIMLQTLPVRNPGQLVLFYDGVATGVYSGNGFHGDYFSFPEWQYFNGHLDSFESLCAFRQGSDSVVMHVAGTADGGLLEQANINLVGGNYFDLLGVRAAAGRLLGTADDTVAAPRVAVLSYPFWQDRFRGERSVIGKTAVLNGTSFTIVGVAAQEFFGLRVQTPPNFWLPLSSQPQVLQNGPWLTARNVYWLNMIGRLRPGAPLRTAEAAMNIRLHQFYLEQAGTALSPEMRRQIQSVRVDLKPGGRGISWLRFRYSEPLHVLMAVVAMVLLIACANIATLLLARASVRRHEFLARLALGASRGRLIRQVLTESMVLSLIGGTVGTGFAWWGVKGLLLLLGVNPVVKVHPDPMVLAFTFFISVVTGMLFGIFPALRFSRMEMRPGAQAKLRSAQLLIIFQVAISLVLLLGAGLLAHSLFALEHQEFGFKRGNLLVVRTDPHLAGYQPKELFPLYRELDERLNRIPGVISASLARYTPESGTSSSNSFSIVGSAPSSGKEPSLFGVEVGPHFFETLGIPLLLGRTINPRDTPNTVPVVVVNATFVKLYFPGQNPIGKRISFGSHSKSALEIVGVVGDSKYYDVRDTAKPMAFTSVWQGQGESIYAGELLVRTAQDASGMAPAVRQALQSVSSKLPVLDVTTLARQVEESLDQQKVISSLCNIFSGLALLLALIGIYGTVAYAVTRKTTEIGIRMALGASRPHVLWMALRDSLVLTGAGILLGLPAALGSTRWIKSFLFGVLPADPLALGASVVAIVLFASLAGYLPARRSAKIDPLVALRHE
jgi:macrolide transport system ATP-binding/permease protein